MKRSIIFFILGVISLGAIAAEKIFTGKGLQEGHPAMNLWNTQSPGETTPLARPYPIAPPLIPHGVGDLTINRDTNDCLGCHLEGVTLGEGHAATKIPVSHFTNPYTKETKTDTVIGMRYNCLQCHAPQANNAIPPVPQQP